MGNNSKVLLMASPAISAPMLHEIQQADEVFLHLPLEEYQTEVNNEEADQVQSNAEKYSFVLYGNLRNAKHLVEWADGDSLTDIFPDAVHLALDKPTADFLEDHSVPAIMPREQAKPIDLLEFMLRISREGSSLYPCTDQKAEELPGLLQELEMKVDEFTVCSEMSLSKDRLNELRKEAENEVIGTVLLHNRSAVNRFGAAFPDLDLKSKTVISGSSGVTKILIDMGIEPDYEAEGNWYSIASLIKEKIIS